MGEYPILSINVRKETGKLYLDFRFRNMRCREQTELNDMPANRKRLQVLLDKIQAEILLGQFDYTATFPNSRMLEKLKQTADVISSRSGAIPTFEAFAKTWFEEQKVRWSKSYTASIDNIVFGRLAVYFDTACYALVSKLPILNLLIYKIFSRLALNVYAEWIVFISSKNFFVDKPLQRSLK